MPGFLRETSYPVAKKSLPAPGIYSNACSGGLKLSVGLRLKKQHMNAAFNKRLATELDEIRNAGLFKTERIIESPQGAEIISNGKKVLNFCANNYLGLSSHPKVIEAAHKSIDARGYGMSSVRFIC